MSFDPQTSTASAMSFTSTQTEYTKTEVIETTTRPIDEIREKGFRAFIDELHEKKLEELREKILKSMGYTPEDLENMSPEQRQQVEEMVARKMMERMVANAEMNGQFGTVIASYEHIEVEITQVQMTSSLAAGTGLGPLLALQDLSASDVDQLPKAEKETG